MEFNRHEPSPCLCQAYSFRNALLGQRANWNAAFWWLGVLLVKAAWEKADGQGGGEAVLAFQLDDPLMMFF